jgi:UDP-N-acetylglucosamine--N-acetylmuramyl-(pentapeptide) pyrophosphoryl-undecaprenol N-acetylglucosamine transferase
MNFLFTCGGTAGHINPALAVAGRLRELMPDCGILFVGADGHMETNLVPRAGYDIKTVNITNISRGRSLSDLRHNIETVKNVVTATKEAKKIISAFKPDAAVGTGGYVCYPVLKAAHEMGVPTAVHESNAVPGLTTKMLSDSMDCIMVGFEESRSFYKHPERVTVTGTPVRGDFARYSKTSARAELGIPADRPLVVSVWGSLGAGHMNELMTEFITLSGRDPGFSLIHSSGNAGYEPMIKTLKEKAPDYEKNGMDVREYIYDMPRVMAAADLVMCRAGASTLAELTYMGKPVILVPSPNVTNNHQEKNARVIENAGGAKVFLEGEFDAMALLDTVKGLLASPEEMESMAAAMKDLAVPDSADRIAELVLGLCR